MHDVGLLDRHAERGQRARHLVAVVTGKNRQARRSSTYSAADDFRVVTASTQTGGELVDLCHRAPELPGEGRDRENHSHGYQPNPLA